MRGHIRRHGKGYVVVVDIGRDENGRRQQKWHRGYTTEKEAEAALVDILHRLGRNEYVAPSKVTVAEYLKQTWFPHLEDQVQAEKLRPTTVYQYKTLCETHIIPALGHTRLRPP